MPVKSILIAVNDTPVTEELVRVSCKIAKLEKAKVYIVYVFEVPRALPLDAEISEEFEKGDLVLEKAAAVAEEFGLEPETDIIQARAAGTGIVDEARDLGADLIAVGMNTKPKLGDYIFGSTVNYVLDRAPCQVIVVRNAIKN